MRVFAFRLAVTLGEIDVDEMLSSIPLSLFHEWAEYSQLELLGGYHVDSHLARIACILANAHRDPKKRRRPFETAEFMMVSPTRRVKRQTPEQMKQVLRAFTNAHRAHAAQRGGKRG